jgi:hypothetical protein
MEHRRETAWETTMGRFARRLKVAAAVALASAGTIGAADARFLPPSPATLEVYDRANGSVLQVYEKDGQRYIVGTPGHEYALRIRNTSSARILAVTSVDGVNVVTGDTASPDQSGYVIDAYGSVEISGWRKGMDRVAAFYFTDLGDSYAARTGRPQNVGVIGVAVFREKADYYGDLMQRRKAQIDPAMPREQGTRDSAAPMGTPSAMPAPPPSADAPAGASGGASSGATSNAQAAPSTSAQPMGSRPAEERADAKTEPRGGFSERGAKRLASKLGTGHGRSETSYVTQVRFERATSQPAQMLTIQYDRRENLVAMGVLRDDWYARREPQAFPGTMKFVPDPR